MELNKQLLWTIPLECQDTVRIYSVDRNYVILNYYSDYTMGGHNLVGPEYVFIPDEEIWIDQDMDELGRESTAVHELTEYCLMKYKGRPYDEAHAEASVVEHDYLKQFTK